MADQAIGVMGWGASQRHSPEKFGANLDGIKKTIHESLPSGSYKHMSFINMRNS